MRQEERVAIVRQIVNAWEKTNVPVTCELCQHPDWTLIATEDADGVGLPLWHAGKMTLGKFFMAYGVQCKKCGNVRLMAKLRVEELAASDEPVHG